MTITVYGLSNCDTVKKARAWLAERRIDAAFHDFKKQGVPTDRLDVWLDAVGWEALLNRRGTTWRKLDEAERDAVTDTASTRALLLAHPSAIKRPVVDWHGRVTVGFDPAQWPPK